MVGVSEGCKTGADGVTSGTDGLCRGESGWSVGVVPFVPPLDSGGLI